MQILELRLGYVICRDLNMQFPGFFEMIYEDNEDNTSSIPWERKCALFHDKSIGRDSFQSNIGTYMAMMCMWLLSGD